MRARILVVLLTLVMGAMAGACSTEIADGLDERQAQEALAVLSTAGIGATRVGVGEGKSRRYRIEVGSSDAGHASAVLRAQGLPRAPERGFAETYGSASMIPTPTEEKARFLKALAGEVATQLEQLESVTDASVIVTAPTEDPLAPIDAPKGRPTAAVLLKVRAGATHPAEESVKKLVAGAVEGLQAVDVAVVTEEVPAASATSGAAFDKIGPIRVARSSKGALVGVLAAACALVIAMGVWVVLSERRVQAARRPRSG